MELAKRIRTIRLLKNLKQISVAEKIGVTQATYSSYERRAGNCTFNTLMKISAALEVKIAFLVDIDNPIEFDDSQNKL